MGKYTEDVSLDKYERDDQKRYGSDFRKSVTRNDVHKCFGIHVKLHNKLSEQLSDAIERCEYEAIEEFADAKSEARLLFQALTRSTKIVAEIYSKLDAQDIEAKKLVNEEAKIDEALQGFMKMLADLGIEELDAIGFKDAILKKAAQNDQSSEEANGDSFQNDHGAISDVNSFEEDEASLAGFTECYSGNVAPAEKYYSSRKDTENYHGSDEQREGFSGDLVTETLHQASRDVADHYPKDVAADERYPSNLVSDTNLDEKKDVPSNRFHKSNNFHANNTSNISEENNAHLSGKVEVDNVFTEGNHRDERGNYNNQQSDRCNNLRQENIQQHHAESRDYLKNNAQQKNIQHHISNSEDQQQNCDYQNSTKRDNSFSKVQQQNSIQNDNIDSKARLKKGEYQNSTQHQTFDFKVQPKNTTLQKNIQQKQNQRVDLVCAIENPSKKLIKGRNFDASDMQAKQRQDLNSAFYNQEDYQKKFSNSSSITQNFSQRPAIELATEHFSHLPSIKSSRENFARPLVRKIFADQRTGEFLNSANSINDP